MKTQHKIVILSALLGILTWVIDSVVDTTFFYKGVPPELIINDLPTHHVYMRVIMIVCFLSFGIIASLLFSKQKKAEDRLKHTNAVLNALRNVDQLTTRERNREKLLKGICDTLIETRGYHNVWIGLYDESGEWVSIYQAGLGEKITPLREQLQQHKLPDCVRSAMVDHQVIVTKSPGACCVDCSLASNYKGREGFTTRLQYEEKCYGVLVASIPRGFGNDEEERTLFKELAGDISFALHALEIEEARTHMEEALARSEESYRNLIDTISDAIISTNEEGIIIACNKKAEELFGYTREEMMGMPVTLLTAPLDREKQLQSLKRFHDEKTLRLQGKPFRVRGLRKDGSEFLSESTLSARLEDGHYILTGVLRDISEKERGEQEVKRTRDFLESVIESSRDGIVITNEKGYITSCNTAMERISGFKKEELVGNHASIFFKDKDERKKILKKTAELFERGFTSYEAHHQNKDGTFTPVECNVSLIRNEQGQGTAGVAIIRDITERKKLEQQMLQSEKLRSLGELAGGVAHDFNNILTAILGNAQLLQMSLDNVTQKGEKPRLFMEMKKRLGIIEQAARDGAETVRRIQDFSRRTDDDNSFTTVDTNEVITQSLEFTKVRWKDEAEKKGITYNVITKLASVSFVTGRDSELREVMINLINNALDAMPQGGEITIETFVENEHLNIQVKDTGTGIPRRVQPRIFDPFFTTKGVKSSGLGLSVSYGIISRHRGTITVESDEGKGTTFTIKLPLLDKQPEVGKSDTATPTTFKRARILVIEDEEEVRNLLTSILSAGDHQVETTADGTSGIELFKQKPFDLVFTDLGMPDINGWQVAEKIKGLNHRVPVALITGWQVELNNDELQERGIDLIMSKPFSVEQVLHLVEKGMILKEKGNLG